MVIIQILYRYPMLRYLAILCIVTISFLFTPKPASPSEYLDGSYVSLGKHMGFMVNCDSYTYLKVSMDPSLLLQDKSLRQSRPLFLVLGAIPGKILYTVLRVFNPNIYKVYFVGYILLNFIFYLLALKILDRILIKNTILNVVERSAFLFLLISNDVTKTFFWTPEKQYLVFLTPLLCIYLMQYLTEHNKIAPPRIAFISFLCGLSLLVYGNFMILVICLLAMLVFRRYNAQTIFMSLLLIALPTVTWMVILKCNGVNYYNHEIMAYHQFVWVFESLNKSFNTFCARALNFLYGFIGTFKEICVFVFLLVVMMAYRAVYVRSTTSTGPLVYICCFLIAVSLLFFYFMGYYADRLTYTLLAPLLVLIALFYSDIFRHQKRLSAVILFLFVVTWHVYNITKYGPFG